VYCGVSQLQRLCPVETTSKRIFSSRLSASLRVWGREGSGTKGLGAVCQSAACYSVSCLTPAPVVALRM
jgi:hypothetical protein